MNLKINQELKLTLINLRALESNIINLINMTQEPDPIEMEEMIKKLKTGIIACDYGYGEEKT